MSNKLTVADLAPTAEERVGQAVFAVEADRFAQHTLWSRHASKSRDHGKSVVEWDEVSHGWLVTVGKLGERPVCISVNWAILDGQPVLFWHATSQVVDYEQIDTWLKEHFKATWDGGRRRAVCDADNFHLCLQAVRELNEPSKNDE